MEDDRHNIDLTSNKHALSAVEGMGCIVVFIRWLHAGAVLSGAKKLSSDRQVLRLRLRRASTDL